MYEEFLNPNTGNWNDIAEFPIQEYSTGKIGAETGTVSAFTELMNNVSSDMKNCCVKIVADGNPKLNFVGLLHGGFPPLSFQANYTPTILAASLNVARGALPGLFQQAVPMHKRETTLTWNNALSSLNYVSMTLDLQLVAIDNQDTDIKDPMLALASLVVSPPGFSNNGYRAPRNYSDVPNILPNAANPFGLVVQIGKFFRLDNLFVEKVSFDNNSTPLYTGYPSLVQAKVSVKTTQAITMQDLEGFFL